MSSRSNEATPEELLDFSLVAGGPIYQLWRSVRLADEGLQLVRRRILALASLAWVPLLLLSMAEGHAWGSGVTLTFLKDLETHARLLIALPLLILAEAKVHRRASRILRNFIDRGLIPDAKRPQFSAALASATRLRNSVPAELLLIVFVYAISMPFIWRAQAPLGMSSWCFAAEGEEWRLWRAGWWAAWVSMPLFQFLLVRWYFRLLIWARLLWQVSRIRLNLMPAHPDGVAGLHFLNLVNRAYSYVLLAQGAVLSGLMANRIFSAGAGLMDFKVELLGTVALMVFAVLGPLLAFTPQLRAARRHGMEDCGALGQAYATDFDRKWFRGGAPAGEPLIGSPDIQSLADLSNSFQVIRRVEWAPFSLKTLMDLALTTLLPVAPLLLTTFSVEELITRVLKVLL